MGTYSIYAVATVLVLAVSCNHPQKHHGGTDAQIGLQAHTNEKFYYFKEMQIILRRAGITNPVSQGRHDTHN